MAVCALSSEARAQSWITLAAGAGSARLTRTGPAAGAPLNGLALGGEARIGGRFAVELGYLQAALSPDSGAAGARDLVDARAMAVARIVPWLSLKAGAHLVGFVSPSGTERWLRWEGRARLDAPAIADALSLHVELWLAAATDVNVTASGAGARGGEAGVTWFLPRTPLSVRLSYSVDHADLGGGAGTASVEGIGLQLRFARR
jgi:hypothetical protein